MTDTPTNALPILRFIPFRRRDIVTMCEQEGGLSEEQAEQFRQANALIEDFFQRDFHAIKQRLKDAYAPLDPDADTRCTAVAAQNPDELSQTLASVLNRGNYEKVTEEGLNAAFESASLFNIRLFVDLNDFDDVLLYTRGVSERTETLSGPLGLFSRTVTFRNFDRVVLYIRFKSDIDENSTLGGCRPGATMLKLFKDVPEADLEMLFPNTRIGMRFRDKLLIGIPALISGGVVLTTKVGATLLLLGSLFGFWLGLKNEPVTLDRNAVLALAAGLGALGGYLWKQFSNFRNRKLRFTQALTRNLYFKLLDNNAGVIHRILDDAEESECKESTLAYYFLLRAGEPLSAEALDETIESWFQERWQCTLDFEVDDALNKLERLGLAEKHGEGAWIAKASSANSR
ncbi:hypothetical protein FHR99_000581 [Litorivivens lipolytica]|uniref:DUF3754 domain-containing protein n=1 Tax=Litorivivens lipolytica TaxID=1524264 RepID=A0A7W4W2P2_9GAMM|nr:TMEM143 family protein [Litorivivens lipolytica]MBB3046345.1 hypothetical protein [Litorivivens lipolytica]